MTSNIVELKQQPLFPSTRRVSPHEAKWIHQTNIETADVVRDWYHGPNSLRSRINNLDHSLSETLEHYTVLHKQHREKGYKDFQPKFSQKFYWPILIIAVILETPLNKSALELLQMDNLSTLMIAASIGVLNVIGASLLGWKIRQTQWNLAGLRDWLFVIALLAVLGAVMFGLAGLRLDTLIYNAKKTGIDIPISNSTYISFVTFQLLFLIVGAFISYSAHSADADLERIIKHKLRLRQRADQLLHQRGTLASQHDSALGQANSSIHKLRTKCLAAIAEYRDYNMATRTTPSPHWLQIGLEESVFAPIDLGTELDNNPPTLEELLSKAEKQAETN